MLRRKFTQSVLTGVAVASSGALLACGDDDNPGGGSDAGKDGSVGQDGSTGKDAAADGSKPDAMTGDAAADASGQDAAADASGQDASVGSFEVSTKEGDPHVHSFTVSCAVFDQNGMATFMATGSGHMHDVKISAADLDKVLAGETVEIMTTSGGHTHTFVFDMPAGAC